MPEPNAPNRARFPRDRSHRNARAPLERGFVDHTDRARFVDVAQLGRQRRQPRPVGGRGAGDRHGAADLADEQLELGPLTIASVERSGAPGDLELDEVARTETHHGPARHTTRQRGCGRIADHVEGVGPVVQAQRHSQVGVGADVVVDHPRRPLRREHEVHTETPATLGDPDHGRNEVGEVDGERGELVDDDGESWKRRCADDRPMFGEVGGARLAEQPLASMHLGLEADQCTRGEPVVEVGDEPDRVGEVGTRVERRAALVVDEHERHVVRADARRDGDDERAERFALAGAGRPGDQSVRTIADEVDLDDAVE